MSTPIPSALEQLGSPTDPLASSDVADLRRFLVLVADPRDTRGLRYPALALLCAAVSAVVTGARSLIAMEAGESVVTLARWLGHSSPTVTLRYYAHFMPEAGSKGRTAIDGLLGE